MRFYGNIEEANKEARQRAENYRKATEYIPTITKILKDFDNKGYNCRLEKALQEATNNRVFCKKNDYYLEIYTYPERGYSFHVTLAHIKVEDLKDGKRIPAAKIIESFQGHRETLLKNAYEIETGMEQMAQAKAYIEQTKNKLESFCRSFNSDLRDIYGLPYCVRVD